VRSPDEIAFRLFRAEDQERVRNLVLSGLADHFGTLDPTMNPDLLDIAANYVDAGAVVVVAELDDEIVGTGTLIQEGERAGRLVRMSAVRSIRGRGLGKRLVSHLLEAARARGYSEVFVETNHDWEDAIGLYRACGFTDLGVWDGDIHMRLSL
jgi:ribosomal protein S18 acetylase RimI-like enzyme